MLRPTLPLLLLAALPLAAQTKPETTTLRSSTRLVIVDVTVTDRSHKPVHHLSQADFTLLEDKNPQQIRSFEEHSAIDPASIKLEPAPKLPPGVFSNFVASPINSATNVLLLDTLNTPIKDQAYLRSQLLDYLKHVKPGTSIAIFGLSTQLVMLQGFTSDPEILKAAVAGKKYNASPLLDDAVNGTSFQPTQLDQAQDNPNTSAQVIANLATLQSVQTSFQLQLRAKYTLDGMNLLARYLVGIPGRKNLIWFSGSFPLDVLPDGDAGDLGGDPFAGVASSEDEYRETVNLLTRSQVAVYPVDARGLMTTPVFDAANSGAGYSRNPSKFANQISSFGTQTGAEHATMFRIAQETGGEAFVNTNALNQAVEKAIDSGSNYYTLTYSPSNPKWNGNYRKIAVQLREQGYTLSFRRGYYADDPEDPSPRRKLNAVGPTAVTNGTPIQYAMKHGAPPATQIAFKARVLPATTSLEQTAAPQNDLNPNSKLARPPFRRFNVDFAANPADIRFTKSPQGTYTAALEFMVFVYSPDGDLVNITDRVVDANIKPEAYNNILHGGLQFHTEISVPVKGDWLLRVAVHDTNADRVGTTEIPVAAVKNLPPATPPGAPAPPARPTPTPPTP